jgi:Head domain of trimeric autotransporter adhesin
MKKILIFLILICLFGICQAQYTTIRNYSSATTLENAAGGLKGGLITNTFVDTIAANNNAIKFYDGAIIRVADSLFMRSLGGWVKINKSGAGTGTVQSVGLTMPSAFTVSNSPVTSIGTIGVVANGTTSQYIRGNGTLQTFPTIPSTTNLFDSLKRTGLIVAGRKNGNWVNQFSLPDSSGGSGGWSLTGNSGTTGKFIGTTDNKPLVIKINNTQVAKFDTLNGNVSFGYSTSASGEGSFAMGVNSIASGRYSTALGQSMASDDNSLSMGNGAVAGGFCTSAMGENAISRSYAETTIGVYNEDYTPISTNSWVGSDRLFQVGNGDGFGDSIAATHNALTILKNGNTGIGTTTPAFPLDVNGITNASEYKLHGAYGLQSDGLSYTEFLTPNGGDGMYWYNTGFGLTNWYNHFLISASSDGVSDSSLNFHDYTGKKLMTLKNGNVGIGTTSPTHKLTISSFDTNVVKITGLIEGQSTDSLLSIDAGGNVHTKAQIDTTFFAGINLTNTFTQNQIINAGRQITLGTRDGDYYGLFDSNDNRIATYSNGDQYYSFAGGKIVSSLSENFTRITGNFLLPNIEATNLTNKKIMLVDTTANNKVYYVSIDSFATSASVNERVKYSDTASMLSAYRTAIGTKLNTTDTANIRVRLSAGTNITSISGTYPNLTINAAAQTTDTSSLSTRINARVKYTDTSSMLSAYRTAINTKLNTSDTANVRVRLSAGTNITSISGTYPNLTINAAAQTTDTSSLSTSATSDLDMGANNANAQAMHVKGTSGNGHLGLRMQSNIPSASANESSLFANVDGNIGWQNSNNYYTILKTTNNTTNRIYTFQNKAYTIGDSADIAARVKYTDTSSMLSAYQTAINAKGTGTVTSVATGLGLSGGTITTSGTLIVDTSSASIISRQRAAATYTLISDTSLFARKSMPSYSIRVNNTNATANATTDNYKTVAETALGASDSVTYTGVTAPSGTTNNTYHITQIGDRVFGEIILANTVNGAGITSIVIKLPTAFPTPKKPTGATLANQYIYNANATLSNSTNTSISASLRANLRNNYNNTATEIVLNFLSSAFSNTFISFTYPTD